MGSRADGDLSRYPGSPTSTPPSALCPANQRMKSSAECVPRHHRNHKTSAPMAEHAIRVSQVLRASGPGVYQRLPNAPPLQSGLARSLCWAKEVRLLIGHAIDLLFDNRGGKKRKSGV